MPAGCCNDAEARRKTQHRDKQSTLQRYEFHFTLIQRTSSVTYFAVRKTKQHKLPQLKLGPTIYAIGPPVAGQQHSNSLSCRLLILFGLFSSLSASSTVFRMRILLAFFSTKSANSTVFRMRIFRHFSLRTLPALPFSEFAFFR